MHSFLFMAASAAAGTKGEMSAPMTNASLRRRLEVYDHSQDISEAKSEASLNKLRKVCREILTA